MNLTIPEIITVVSERFDIPEHDILSDRRDATLARARHIVFWLALRLTYHNSAQIGREMRRDHSSVLHGKNVIEEERWKNDVLQGELNELTKILGDLVPSLEHLVTELHHAAPEIQTAEIHKAVMKTGGTWQPPETGFGDHQFTIKLFEICAYGMDAADACRNWLRVARATLVPDAA